MIIRRPAPIAIVTEGQSHNRWPPKELVPGTPWEDGLGPYPNRLMANYPGIPWQNASIGGHGWGDLTTDVATRLFPLARTRAGCIDILIMSGGQGDIYQDGQTGEQTYDRAVVYANNARAKGFDIVIATTMPAVGPDAAFPVGTNAAFTDHNLMMMDDPDEAFDRVVDWHTHHILSFSDPLAFESDQIHFKTTTATLAASLVKPVLDDVLASI